MEAMVSAMAVVIVLSMYLAFAAASAGASYDPLEDFDPDSLDARIAGGVSISESYPIVYLANNDLDGMSITITVPGYDDRPHTFQIGEADGPMFSSRYTLLLDYDGGRRVPALLEVAAFA